MAQESANVGVTHLLELVEGGEPPLQFSPGTHVLGRASDCDMPFGHGSVSSHHCEVVIEGESCRIRDLNSTNGTYVGGRRLDPGECCELTHGEEVTVGSVRFMFREKDRVAIPVMERPVVDSGPQFFDDGSPVCNVMPDRVALYSCGNCGKFFCSEAVRRVGLSGSKGLLFGRGCRGPCDLQVYTSGDAGPETFMDRVKDAMRAILTWRGR